MTYLVSFLKVRSGSNIQWKLRARSNQGSKDDSRKESATKRNTKRSSNDSNVPVTKSDAHYVKSRSLPRDTRFSEFIDCEKEIKKVNRRTRLEADNFSSSILVDTNLYDDVLSIKNVIGQESTTEEQNSDLNITSISLSRYNLSNKTDTSGYISNDNTNSSNSIQYDDNDTCNISNNIRNRLNNDDKPKKKYKREFAFAKNVLHYVPISNHVKRYKKLRKSSLSSSMGSLKNNHLAGEYDFDASCRSRSLSREELKYVSISSPTNFVHVASATNPKLLANSDAISGSEHMIITHEQKFADLRVFKKDFKKIENLKGEKNFIFTLRGYKNCLERL